ncbi:MAG: riboflavin synthase [Hyphomicrobiaceae bacterium]|nr:riboflavin synthase [Hyphomicrobiaceae bacterium]
MFTGIVSDVGELVSFENGHMRVRSSYDPATIDLGASIAHDGCCLTVTDLEAVEGGCIYGVDVGPETLDVTTLGKWQPGQRLNLERALAMGAELGGHLMTGHVDGLALLSARRADGDSERFTFKIPPELARFIAAKGSVALNGTSLTVNEVTRDSFGICLIPHTLKITNWNERQVGDNINLEIDLLARYVARLSEMDLSEQT